jgi:peptidyl-prolyl cis-trans isomerase B (cyclophilin B)
MPDAQLPRRTARFLVGIAVLVLGLVVAVLAVALFRQMYRPAPGPAPPAAVSCAPPVAPPTTHPTFTAPPDVSVAAGSQWTATVRTTCGDLGLVLETERAPRSVASFVTLARAGYWTDSACHRLTSRQAPTAFLQCGDPTGRSTAEPGYDLPLENVPADRTYRVGDVGLARGDGFPGTAGEFFVVHHDFTAPADGPAYSVIGHVTSGQEVVQHVASGGGEDTRPDGPPFESISVLSVDVRRR